MTDKWADKFTKKIKEKELALQKDKKNVSVYKTAALKLFDFIESKLKRVEVISTSRILVGDASPAPGSIKALCLKCQDRVLKFVPEGINLDDSRGRIRIEHKCRNLAKFIYLHLIVDVNSEAVYPENLIWVFNARGEDEFDFTSYPRFDEQQLEKLIENCFLE